MPRAGRGSRFRTVSGLMLLFGGLILAIPGVPGPGIPLMLVGLVILSERFAWAKRVLNWTRAKARRAGLPEWKWLEDTPSDLSDEPPRGTKRR